MGDSHAWMLIPTFVAIAQSEHLTLSVSAMGRCVWQRGVFPTAIAANGQRTDVAACVRTKEDAYNRVIPTLNPDIIILSNAEYNPGIQRATDTDGSPKGVNEDDLERATRESIADMKAPGRRIVLIDPTPQAGRDPMKCLAQAKFVEECRVVASRQHTPLELYYRRLAARDKAVVDMDLDPVVCPFLPICDPIVDGVIVKWDQGHLTVAFAKSIAPGIDAYFKALKLLPR